MKFSEQLRKGWLIFIKYTLNRLTLRIARSSFGPFAIVRHVGRRSGKHYETPIIARPAPAGFVIELTYGPEVDWHKNVLAAGGCSLVWHGQEYTIRAIEPIDADTGLKAFSPWQQRLLRLLRRQEFEIMLYTQSKPIARN